MAIKKIRISNFKSFKNLDLELGKFTVLIGANASGKSNFIQIFKFLRDITNHGLENAISMQGGVGYLRNISIGSSKDFSLEIVFDTAFRFMKEQENKLIGTEIYEVIYKFALKFKKKGLGFAIAEDRLTQKCEFIELIRLQRNKRKEEIKEKEKLGSGEIIFTNVNGEAGVDLNLPKGVPLKKEDIFLPLLREEKLQPRTLFLQRQYLFIPPWENIFSNTGIYDFDPKLPKKAVPITGKAELEEDGSNLAIILKNVIENKDRERKFSNLIKDLLPFIEKVDIEKFADKSLLFKLREIYFQKQYLPASLMSDGTINITALIIALYFERKPLTIIEEPERNIHPYLISKVINMMKDASQKKQIIVTTHNPEVVKHAGLENILLVSRDKEGFSIISRPSEKEEIKIFLANELGIDELYVQNLLEL